MTDDKRGQDAWLEQRDAIASRNAQASKRGKEERAERELQAEARRRKAEQVQSDELTKRRPSF
jgi:hypothetical protein